jgi:hypothetical protein
VTRSFGYSLGVASADGTFVAEGLPLGDYFVQCHKTAWGERTDLTKLTLDAARPKADLQFALGKKQILYVRLMWPSQGKPLTQFRAWASFDRAEAVSASAGYSPDGWMRKSDHQGIIVVRVHRHLWRGVLRGERSFFVSTDWGHWRFAANTNGETRDSAMVIDLGPPANAT